MALREEALQAHKTWQGKIEVSAVAPAENAHDLTLAYTPGVAEPCKEIAQDEKLVYDYTAKGNLVAIVTDGTAVLGLGDIGPKAAIPVMEGKAVLFKRFANVDAFPICLDTKDPDEIVRTVKLLEPVFGGINLEDIASPRCFEIEKRLKKELNIPVFHDDQHGTAIVILAALCNALKVVKKELNKVRIVLNGAGAAGLACAKLLLSSGVTDLTLVDRFGILDESEPHINEPQKAMLPFVNPRKLKGTLADAVKGADVFIGVSAANVLKEEMVRSMHEDAIIFAMANPNPEIMPDLALKAGARVVGTGRSDFPNQINNVLAFPGIFRGALDVQASDINEEMKIASAYAIADLVENVDETHIMPYAFDPKVSEKVAQAVREAARKSGVARK